MGVGSTTDFDVGRDELIELSLGLVGVTEASPTEIAHAVKILNLLLRHLDARGDWLHTISNTESTLTTINNQQAYGTGLGASNISASILRLEYAALLIGNRRVPLTKFDKASALSTPLKDDTGEPVAVHLETAKLRSDQRLLFYPTPNAAYTVKYVGRRPLWDFDTATDNPDFPSDFLLPISKLLAFELGPHYGMPLPERQLLQQEGEIQFQTAIGANSSKPAYVPLKTEFF